MSNVLYHVTYARNLEGIASSGLTPGRSSNFGGSYTGHSSGRVFLCDFKSVPFWMRRIWDMAEANSDTPLEDGLIPIALKVKIPRGVDIHQDEPGSRDSRGGAFYVESRLSSSDMAYWDGFSWSAVGDAELEDLIEEAKEHASMEDYGDGEIYWEYGYGDGMKPKTAAMTRRLAKRFLIEKQNLKLATAPWMLGVPGGPCHIIRDLQESDLAPEIKEELIREVEQGSKLDNDDANLLYPQRTIRAEAELFKTIWLSSHAQYRMNLRGITVNEIQNCFDEFNRWYNARIRNKSQDEIKTRHKRMMEDLAKGDTTLFSTRSGVTIVFAIDPRREQVRLVSCWWTSDPNPPKVNPGECDYIPYLDDPRQVNPKPKILGANMSNREVAARIATRVYKEAQFRAIQAGLAQITQKERRALYTLNEVADDLGDEYAYDSLQPSTEDFVPQMRAFRTCLDEVVSGAALYEAMRGQPYQMWDRYKSLILSAGKKIGVDVEAMYRGDVEMYKNM